MIRMNLVRSATAVLIVGAALAACGGSSAPTSSGPTSLAASPAPGRASTAAQTSAPAETSAPGQSSATVNVCTLITQKEATAFLGSDPGPGVDAGSADTPACAYGSLVVAIDPTGGRATFDAKKVGANIQTVSGVGDAAYATIVANTVADMEILKGSDVVSILVQGDPALQNITLAALTALGTTVVAGL